MKSRCASQACCASLVLAAAATARAGVLYTQDFNGPLGPEWSGVTSLQGVQGFSTLPAASALGQFSGNLLTNQSNPSPTTLTITGIGAHTSVSIGFLLAIINSWDGTQGFHPNTGASPDVFRIEVDGNTVFDETFGMSFLSQGSYNALSMSGRVNGWDPTRPDLGFGFQNPDFADDGWDMSFAAALQNIPHNGSTLTIDLFAHGGGWQGGSDEYWGVDNLVVSIDGEPGVVPLPTAGLLAAAGLGGIGAARRRRPA